MTGRDYSSNGSAPEGAELLGLVPGRPAVTRWGGQWLRFSLKGPVPHRWFLALLLAAVLGGCSITAPSRSPGYADLDSLGMFDVDNTFTISLGPALLRFAAAHMDDDDEARALFRELDGIRIRVYEIDGSSERVGKRLNRMQSRLREDGWEPVMLVREQDSQVHLLVKTEKKARRQRICGMTLLAMEDDGEVVVINLMGDIQPSRFGDVMVALDVDSKAAREVEVADNG